MQKNKIRVNVPNPEYPDKSNQQRVTAVIDDSHATAHTASGVKVELWNGQGQIRSDIIVHGRIPD